MKIKLFVLAIVAAIALVVVPLAIAAGGQDGNAAQAPAKSKPFLAQGTVVSVDLTNMTMLVTVARGSHNMKSLFGKDVPFTLAPGSHIFARTVGRHGKVHFKHATLAQVTIGSRVNINGRVDRSVPDAPVYLARHIVVRLAPVVIPVVAPAL